MEELPIGRRRTKLTYHAKTGRVSFSELSVPAVTHIARALREVEPLDADQAEFYAAMVDACDEMVKATSQLDHGNVEVVKEIPWMRRLAPRA